MSFTTGITQEIKKTLAIFIAALQHKQIQTHEVCEPCRRRATFIDEHTSGRCYVEGAPAPNSYAGTSTSVWATKQQQVLSCTKR